MFPSMIRTCRSNPIRIIGTIYGVPYDSFPLFFNGLKGAYTDYTDFSNTMPLERELRVQKRT